MHRLAADVWILRLVRDPFDSKKKSVLCSQLHFSSSTINQSKAKLTTACFRATNIDTVSLFQHLHFLFSIILFVVLEILSSTAHTLFLQFPLFPFSSTSLSEPHSLFITTGVQQADIVRATTENDVINYLGRDYVIKLLFLWFCGAMCACSHLTVCTCTLVYVGVHCVVHIIICRHEWKPSMWAICWLNL